jgi:SulP family sulfate permease
VAALAGVLLFGTLPGLFIGIGVSVLLLVYRASRPHVAVLGQAPGERRWVDLDRHGDAVVDDGLLVVRPESELFYGNADNVHGAIRARVTPATRAVVLDAESVPVIDVTATGMLGELSDELAELGIPLLIARDVGQVRDILARAGVASLSEHLYPTVEAAVAAARHPAGEEP